MANINLKQFVVVPKTPKMSAGKIASQVAHATFMALRKDERLRGWFYDYDSFINKWKENGMCVIVLECKNSKDLLSISKYLDQWNICNYLYIDEGLTEVDAFTPTALATGILTEDKFWIFEKMRLLK